MDPHDLSIINQSECRPVTAEDTGLDINIDEQTFTAQSAAGVVRKAGEKIGDGIEVIASGASKVYGKISGKKNEDIKEPDAEWLP